MKKSLLIRILAVILSLTTVITMCVVSNKIETNRVSDSNVKKVVLLGDELLSGENGTGKIVADYLGEDVVDYTASGETAASLNDKLSSMSGDLQSDIQSADIVLISVGYNDILTKILSALSTVATEYGMDINKYNTLKDLLAFQPSSDEEKENMKTDISDKLSSMDRIGYRNSIRSICKTLATINGKVYIMGLYNPLRLNVKVPSWSDATAVALSRQSRYVTEFDKYVDNVNTNGIGTYIEGAIKRANATNEYYVDIFSAYGDSANLFTGIDSLNALPNSIGQIETATAVLKDLGVTEPAKAKSDTLYNKLLQNSDVQLRQLLNTYGTDETKTDFVNYSGSSILEEETTTTEAATTTTATKPAVTTSTTTTAKPETTTTSSTTTTLSTTTTTTQTTQPTETESTTVPTSSTDVSGTTTTQTTTTENKNLGDINRDGRIDAKDATAILVDYAKVLTGQKTTLDISVADVNGDGKADSKDAVVVLKYYSTTLVGNKQTLLEYIASSKNTSGGKNYSPNYEKKLNLTETEFVEDPNA